HAGPAGLPERKWFLRHGNAFEPLHAQLRGKLAHIGFLVDHPGIEHIVDRRPLPQHRSFEHFSKLFKVLAAAFAGGFDQQFGHAVAVFSRKTAAGATLSLEFSESSPTPVKKAPSPPDRG